MSMSGLKGLGQRCATLIRDHELAALTAVLLVFACAAADHASSAPFWFDEFFTLSIARLPSLNVILQALPADGQPPLQYLLTRGTMHLFGDSELAMRLPELIAYLCSGVLVWRITRRRGTAVDSLFAIVLLLGGYAAFEQSFMARPYSLLLASTALAFVCWQSAAGRSESRLVWLTGLALAITTAIFSHHFGVLHIGMFLLAGEMTRLAVRRKLDFPMLAAIALGGAPIFFTANLARRSSQVLGQSVLHAPHFWAKPSIADLFSYIQMIALVPLVLLVIFSMLMSRNELEDLSDENGISSHEWAAVGALALLLPAILLFTWLKTGYFLPRYATSCALGLAILVAWLSPRLKRLRVAAQPAVALSTIFFLMLAAGFTLWEHVTRPPDAKLIEAQRLDQLLKNAPSNLLVVVANSYDYPQFWWYSSLPTRERLIYLADPPFAVQQTDFLPELSLVADRAFIPMPVADYGSFLSEHNRFLVLRSGLDRLNWTEARLTDSGWRLSVLSRTGNDVLYLANQAHPAIPATN